MCNVAGINFVIQNTNGRSVASIISACETTPHVEIISKGSSAGKNQTMLPPKLHDYIDKDVTKFAVVSQATDFIKEAWFPCQKLRQPNANSINASLHADSPPTDHQTQLSESPFCWRMIPHCSGRKPILPCCNMTTLQSIHTKLHSFWQDIIQLRSHWKLNGEQCHNISSPQSETGLRSLLSRCWCRGCCCDNMWLSWEDVLLRRNF